MKQVTFCLSILCLSVLSCKVDDTNPNAPDREKGIILNTKNALDAIPEADFDQEALKIPSSFSLDGPPILSQGKTSKCVAFSGAYYILSLYNGVTNASANNDIATSPEFAYAYYKKAVNDNDCDNGCYLFNEGNDKGLSEILQTVGTTTWNQTPFVNSKICSVVNSTQQNQAAANKVEAYYRLDKKEYNNINEIKTWIYGGYPLWFAVNVEDNWGDIGTGTWTSSSGKPGAHAMVIVGYDDARKAFKVANSWGTTWGDSGYGWIDYDFFKTLISEVETIGVLYPNNAQKPFFNKLTPGSCGRAGWGRITIQNKRNEEIAVEMTGTSNYVNDNADPIDALEKQDFTGIPKGNVTVKIFNKAKTTILREYSVTVTVCEGTVITVQ